MPYLVPDAVHEPLYAIVPYFNPWRWKSREKHTIRAIKHFQDSGAVVILVEAAFGRRDFAFENSGLDGEVANCNVQGEYRFRHRYIKLRTRDELWLKENLINIGVSRVSDMDYNWQNVCWLDSDIHFVRPNWVGEAIHKLQHGGANDTAFLQMFSHARDLGPNYEILDESYPHANGPGLVSAWQQGLISSDPSTIIEMDLRDEAKTLMRQILQYKQGDIPGLQTSASTMTSQSQKLEADLYYHYPSRVWPGLAWACTRKAWEAMGGLLDVAIWGGGDWHMAHALIERTQNMMRDDLHRNYKKIVNQWYQRARTHIRRNVLVMSGSVFHAWHGRKQGRGYNAKHALLAKLGFDPPRHLKRDSQGLWQLNDDRSSAYVGLRDMMRKISLERNEDASEL